MWITLSGGGMKISIVRIGNSKGVILPKPIRELIGLSEDTAELSVDGDSIIIRPIHKCKRKRTPRRRMKKTSDPAGK